MTMSCQPDPGRNVERDVPVPMCVAERDYHECMARFGHNSAEAQVAWTIWQQRRRNAFTAR